MRKRLYIWAAFPKYSNVIILNDKADNLNRAVFSALVVDLVCSCFFRTMYILGYIPKDNRLYLSDKDMNVVGYSLLLSVLEYQTAVMRQDFETAKQVRVHVHVNVFLILH